MSQELKDLLRDIDLQLFADSDGGGGGGQGGNPPQNQNSSPQNPSAPAGRTFTEDYVTSLRTESAGYRTQLRVAEKALREFLGLKPEDQIPDVGHALTAHKTAQQAALEQATKNAKALLVKAEVKVLAKDLDIVDADAAMALADLSKAQVTEDGKVEGVKEALEALLTAKPWLKKAATTMVGGGTNPPGAGGAETNPWKKDTFNLTKQAQILKENSALAARFKAEAGVK